jgi:hypothetical protein
MHYDLNLFGEGIYEGISIINGLNGKIPSLSIKMLWKKV